MYYDFIFDGERLSDRGYMMCTFDGEHSWQGGEITFVSVKPAGLDKHQYYTSQFENPLQCTTSICKSICDTPADELDIITREEQSDIIHWLTRPNKYCWLAFDEEYGYDDVYYNCYVQAVPHMEDGRVIGFDLTIITDSPYGYSKPIRNTYKLSSDNKNKILFNNSDRIGVIYPKTIIKPLQDGEVAFRTGNNNTSTITRIKSVTAGQEIIIDGERDLISGLSSLNNFNMQYPILVNEYRNRKTDIVLLDDSVDCDVTFEYRENRMVIC